MAESSKATKSPTTYKHFFQGLKHRLNKPTLQVTAPSPNQKPLPDHQLEGFRESCCLDKEHLKPPYAPNKEYIDLWQERAGVSDVDLKAMQKEYEELEARGVDWSAGDGLKGERLKEYFRKVGFTENAINVLMKASVEQEW